MTTTTNYGTWCNQVDQYNTSPEASLADFFGSEGADGFDFDAIVADYRQAINEALPDSVVLAGDQFYAPYYEADRDFDGYPLDEDGGLDIKAIVDDIDLNAIVERHQIWTISYVAQNLRLASTASARRTLGRWGVQPIGRQPGRGGESLYKAADILEAQKNRPGQGKRTDLKGAEA